MTSNLAIHGGPKAVTGRHAERWRKIRLADICSILYYALRDVNSVGDGSGPIAKFERRFADLSQTAYALTTNSGTAALHSAYFAVGVKPDTEVIVPCYTWFASATPILQCGGTPVFCDIDERTLTADPDDVEKRITPRTRAICVVHVWGNPAALDRFTDIAKRHNVALIEDCSHAPGATYQGRPVGSWGDVGCFSLQGEKAVTGGEAGVAVTNDGKLFDRMLVLGHNGRTARGQVSDTFDIDNISLGLKYRPHLYGILLALGSLDRLAELNERRRRNYQILTNELADCRAVQTVESYPDAIRGGLLEFILRFNPEHAGGWNCGAFVNAARAEGVPIHVDRYTQMGKKWRLLHESPVFRGGLTADLGGFLSSVNPTTPCSSKNGCLPIAERMSDRLMTMPPFTKVSASFVRQCAAALKKVANAANMSSSSPK